jgi:putative holliday junction resolvase
VILGIDPGTERVGLALADAETRFAYPLRTVRRVEAVNEIGEVVSERSVTTIVVGRPLSLSGESGTATRLADALIEELRAALPSSVTILEFDERFTSVLAERQMRSAGVSSRKARGRVDEIAAQVMLQGFLDSRGELP